MMRIILTHTAAHINTMPMKIPMLTTHTVTLNVFYPTHPPSRMRACFRLCCLFFFWFWASSLRSALGTSPHPAPTLPYVRFFPCCFFFWFWASSLRSALGTSPHPAPTLPYVRFFPCCFFFWFWASSLRSACGICPLPSPTIPYPGFLTQNQKTTQLRKFVYLQTDPYP